MTNTTGTAQKSTKGPDFSAPRDINENTKARRAWLAEKLASVLAESDTDKAKTKIVGAGSYQRVSVWKLVTVEGRERFRGVCQFCGNEQVVDNGVLVLHGYNRPGNGFIVGQCPAVRIAPLNHDDSRTRFWLADYTAKLPTAVAQETEAAAAFEVAKLAAEQSTEDRHDFRNTEPEKPSRGCWIDHVRVWDVTPAMMATYETKLAAWLAQFPLHLAMRDAAQEASNARAYRVHVVDMIAHFERLLSSGVLGSPLTREVVA